MRHKFIAIEGNIGAGKTSLATRLSKHLNSKLILERFADNPFLPKFYEEPERYSFPLELSFLAERYHQLKDELSSDLFSPHIVSDYMFDKSLLFARINLKEDEFLLYEKLFRIITATLPKPDLLVYLHHETGRIQEHIKLRGREYEQNIKTDYLEKLQTNYFEFLKQRTDLKILMLDMKSNSFVHHEGDFEKILAVLNEEYGYGMNKAEV